MPGTLEALVVVALAIVPGLLFRLGFESVSGPWGAGASDQVLRVLAASATFHAFFAVATYRLWQEFVASDALGDPDFVPPLWLWLVTLAYVGVPYGMGKLWAYVRKREWMGTRDPYPTAREYLFGFKRQGWVRLRLKDGTWLAGQFGENPTNGLKGYASQYGDRSADLLLSSVAEVEAETGRWVLDGTGHPVVRGERCGYPGSKSSSSSSTESRRRRIPISDANGQGNQKFSEKRGHGSGTSTPTTQWRPPRSAQQQAAQSAALSGGGAQGDNGSTAGDKPNP